MISEHALTLDVFARWHKVANYLNVGVFFVLHDLIWVDCVSIEMLIVIFCPGKREKHAGVDCKSHDTFVIMHQLEEKVTMDLSVRHQKLHVGPSCHLFFKVLLVVGRINNLHDYFSVVFLEDFLSEIFDLD